MKSKQQRVEQKARARAECQRNHETHQRKNAEKRERTFQLRRERQEIEKLRFALEERDRQAVRDLMQQDAKNQWRKVMDDKEKQARDLLGIAWDQSITEAVVKAFARDRSKELHPDQNPEIDPQRYVQMMDARDYLLEQIKKAS